MIIKNTIKIYRINAESSRGNTSWTSERGKFLWVGGTDNVITKTTNNLPVYFDDKCLWKLKKIYLWFFVNFSGPEGTCFEGGVFPAKLAFPADYPLSPPKMQFTCEIFHPNSEFYLF